MILLTYDAPHRKTADFISTLGFKIDRIYAASWETMEQPKVLLDALDSSPGVKISVGSYHTTMTRPQEREAKNVFLAYKKRWAVWDEINK